MKYLKTYESREIFQVLSIRKDNLRMMKIEIKNLLKKNINFKFLDSGEKNPNFYYVIGKKLLSFTYQDNDIDSYGEELDYNIILDVNKYNL